MGGYMPPFKGAIMEFQMIQKLKEEANNTRQIIANSKNSLMKDFWTGYYSAIKDMLRFAENLVNEQTENLYKGEQTK